MQVPCGRYVRAPSPVLMSKPPTVVSGSNLGSEASLSRQGSGLPPRPLLRLPSSVQDDSSPALGLMNRVTSLFNRALCKPNARATLSSLTDDRHPAASAAYLAAQQQRPSSALT